MLVPAGSTWGGPGGDKWAEVLQEKAPLDSYQSHPAQNGKEFQAKHISPRKLGMMKSSLSFSEVATAWRPNEVR